MTWEVRLGDGQPGHRLAVLAAASFAGLMGIWLMGHILFGLIGFAAILMSCHEVFFPLRYRLDGQSARVRCGWSVSAIEWANVRRVIESPDGVRLSPLPKPSPLDAFRGVFLRYAGNRDSVLAKIRQLRGSDG